MGIPNLLPFVKNACRQGNVAEFSGCSVAVDVSCLLHRGLFGCAESIAQGKKTNFYIYYVEKHIKALLNIGCHVIMVFDGRPLPAKKDTNNGRRQRREDNVKAGELLLAEGKVNEAMDKFKRATSITTEVVESTIEHFRSYTNVDVIVSPYESDAQLAFLVNEHLADVVITEDSDLIAFACEKIAFKWNSERGDCLIYEKSQLPRCFTGVMGSNFDFTKFRRICILAGCDYLQAGLPGIGLNKALSFFSKTSRTDLRKLLPRIPQYLNMSKLTVSKEFVEDFIRAENTFLHQVVFDPRQRCQRPLTPYPFPKNGDKSKEGDDDFAKPGGESAKTESFSYAGEVMSSNVAVRLALGNKEGQSVITDKFYLPATVPEWSVWYDHYESCGSRKRRLEEEKKEDDKKCGGAFQFDSPSKKRRKKETTIDTEDSIIFVDLESESELTSSTQSSSKPSSQSSVELSTQSSSEPCSQSSSDPCSQSSNSCSQSSTEPCLQSPNNQPKSEQRLKTTSTRTMPSKVLRPKSLKNEASNNWTVEEMMKVYGSQTKIETTKDLLASSPVISSGSSAYFVRRSASCANPFRKPVIKTPTASRSSESPASSEQTSSDSTSQEDDGNQCTTLNFKIFGYRPAGLRGSFKS
ncbi:hypothetical protein V3C99_001724 [Haemonchus contortus]